MMTINEALAPLGNGFRNLYRTSDKYSAADMAKLLSGLEIHNFLDDGQSYDGKPNVDGYYQKALTGIDVDKWNKYLVGKTVIFSFDAEWSGFVSNNDLSNRLGFELQTTAEDGTQHWNGSWLYLKTESGKQYCATRMTIYDKPIKSIDYANIYNQINTDATVKITNVKMYIDPLGGVVPANLFEGHFTFDSSLVKRSGNLYQFNVTRNPNDYPYVSMIFITNRVQAKENQSYKLKFKARGNGQIWSYVYGHNYQGTYVDNGHPWQLTNQWQDYEQSFPVDSIPIKNGGLLVDIRTLNPVQGEIADIEFIPA